MLHLWSKWFTQTFEFWTYCTIDYCNVLYTTVLYCTVQECTKQNSTVQRNSLRTSLGSQYVELVSQSQFGTLSITVGGTLFITASSLLESTLVLNKFLSPPC